MGCKAIQKNTHFCFIVYVKPLTVWITTNCGKFLKEMGIPDLLTCLLRNRYAIKNHQLKPDVEQWTASKLGKKYDKAVYSHPACLTYMHSTLCEMLGWMKHKLESRLPAEISASSDVQIVKSN